MKCPECQYNRKVRDGFVCRCGYKFTFNPKDWNQKGFTDGKFVAAIRKAGQNRTAAFTDNQLYAAYTSQAKVNRVPAFVFAFVIAGFSIFAFHGETVLLMIGLGIAVAIAGLSLLAKPNVMNRAQFDECIERWKNGGKEIVGLIEKPSLDSPPEQWPEDDIYDYGVERILIVQRKILVDLLVMNNQHIEQKMLIVSESGYPTYLRDRVNHLLKERSDLPIFLLHDADAAGQSMHQRLQSSSWLSIGIHPVIDLGFFPKDFERLKRTSKYQSGTSGRALPADALLLSSLATGLAACFASHTTFAEELLREKQNAAHATSSFG